MKAESRTANRFPVFLLCEDPTSVLPSHSATFTVAELVLQYRYCVWVGSEKKALQITVPLTWRQVKDKLPTRSLKDRIVTRAIPQAGYSGVGNLDLSYPGRGQESVMHPHHAMREACRAAKKRKEEAARLAAQM